MLSISLLYPKESFTSYFKTARKRFSMEQLPIDFCMLLCEALSGDFQHLRGKVHT